MKLLKRKILFILASEIDYFLVADGFSYKPYNFFYWRLKDYQQSSVRDATLQLVESGDIDKIVRNGVPLFRLTSQGRHRLLSFFTQSWGQRRVWDKIWRLAIISQNVRLPQKVKGKKKSKKLMRVQEKQARDLRKLRRKLKNLGFRKLSRGVYITPLPISSKIKDFSLETKTISAKITVIESRRLLIGDNEQLANHIWGINKLYESYKEIITKTDALLKKIKQEKGLMQKAKVQFHLILSAYFSLLETDPGLPKKLLPRDWPANLAKERFLRLAQRVKETNVS
ncbi:PaaX family transcriptional regulator C-terminal domain-containing protein [Patescibacteria group bacterium]